eukprot:6178411-Pleurochrysis_carterae.AAC.1
MVGARSNETKCHALRAPRHARRLILPQQLRLRYLLDHPSPPIRPPPRAALAGLWCCCCFPY